MNLFYLDQNWTIYVIGGLGVFFLWVRLFYFMQMFQKTAAFVRMILEISIDIRIFLLIYFVGVLAISNCLYITGMYIKIQKYNPINAKIYETIAGEDFLQSFIYVYLQALGELGVENYNSSYAPLTYWTFFFNSSLFLQIVLLNLLIAIMGDTFDRIQAL